MSGAADRVAAGARTGVTVLLLLLFALAFLLALLTPAPAAEGRSVGSTEPDGRRALLLLFATDVLGYTPEAWTGAPAELPARVEGPPPLLFLPAAPPEPGAGPGSDDEATAAPRRLRAPEHYRRFLDGGGTIVAAPQPGALAFLHEQVGVEELGGLALEERRALPAREVTFASGARVTPASRGWAWFETEDGDLPAGVEPLARDDEQRDVVVRVPVGRGAVVAHANPGLLDNEALGRADNALYAVRLLEELEPLGRVLFDEYALGGWRPRSPAQLAFGERTRLATLHVVALAALVLWRSLARRVFPRDRAGEDVQTALTRAEGFAGLLVARRRYDLLAGLLRASHLRRLAARAGIRQLGSELDGAGVPASTPPTELVERVLARLGPEAQAADLVARARVALCGGTPADGAALATLAAELQALENELQAFARTRARRPDPPPDPPGRRRPPGDPR